MRIELAGLEVFAHHGVLEVERAAGQRFLVDVWLEPVGGGAARTDAIADAVDYREVVAVVEEIAVGRTFHLLEALAASLVDALLERLPVAWVRVRVRKPDVLLALPAEHAAVSVERCAGPKAE